MSVEYTRNLGKKSEYQTTYTPSLLDAIPRKLGRNEININDELPFMGFDLWTAFEISWLNEKGKPETSIAEIKVPCTSPNLIESKSLKLYLNSFNQTKVESKQQVKEMIEQDLSNITKSNVTLIMNEIEQKIQKPCGSCIDDVDIEVTNYNFNPSLLEKSTLDKNVNEILYSKLLKSNCLVTNQPDWGTVFIKYSGKEIIKENLLRYIISFRLHNEFHEQCVERIFCDIKKYCKPDKLTVFARYTRRGGLDINPFRSDFENEVPSGRLANQ